MNIQSRQRLKFFLLFLSIQIVLIFSGLSLVVQAQESSPFQISLIPAAEHAVSGQPFTYTVIITNVSQAPVQAAVINVDVPEGTQFVRTVYTDPKWYGGNSYADPDLARERVQLLTPETVEIDEVFSFLLVVDILAQPDEAVQVDDYQVMSIEDKASTSGTPITVEVREPTPTPTPTLTPSPTASPPPTASPTVTATSAPATLQAAVAATATPPLDETNEISATTPSPTTASSSGPFSGSGLSLIVIFVIIAASILIVALIGGVWFLKRR